MKSYISAKIVKAEPGKSDTGGEDGMKIVYPDGYESWCPMDVFNAVYREISDTEKDLVCGVIEQAP